MKNILEFYITFSSKKEAEEVCKKLIDERLIACSNIHNIHSHYRWQENYYEDEEYAALLKTSLALEVEVEHRIIELHSYDVPCILRYEVRSNDTYANWVTDQTKN